MNKKDWKENLKRMEEMLKVAKNNIKSAQDQAEELEYNVEMYQRKIKTFK